MRLDDTRGLPTPDTARADLRAEVLTMGDNERAALDQAVAEIEGKRLEGMAAKSEEFLAGGGKLYMEAGE